MSYQPYYKRVSSPRRYISRNHNANHWIVRIPYEAADGSTKYNHTIFTDNNYGGNRYALREAKAFRDQALQDPVVKAFIDKRAARSMRLHHKRSTAMEIHPRRNHHCMTDTGIAGVKFVDSAEDPDCWKFVASLGHVAAGGQEEFHVRDLGAFDAFYQAVRKRMDMIGDPYPDRQAVARMYRQWLGARPSRKNHLARQGVRTAVPRA